MKAATASEGLKSEALRAALTTALAGRPAALEELFCRYGGGHDTRPNLRLGAAFGVEMQAQPTGAAALLTRLGGEDAAPDTPRVFLPMAAAYGWVGRLRADRDSAQAWAALAELGGDERPPVRFATMDALQAFASRGGGARALTTHASEWLQHGDRELGFGAAASAIEVLADKQVLALAGNGAALMDFLSQAIAAAADAPRSAERSDTRRRLMLALPKTLAATVIAFAAGDRSIDWLENECRQAQRTDVRAVLSDAVVRLQTKGEGLSETAAQRLRAALQGSAKPPRDPTRIRPGQGRGKQSRRVR
ncbi:MAG TPA: hypothetical protein VH374_03065 [Polyangia bacterium]|jgi:hypothetical protein|nr:hypothetical protein [Polyangia bacterium]